MDVQVADTGLAMVVLSWAGNTTETYEVSGEKSKMLIRSALGLLDKQAAADKVRNGPQNEVTPYALLHLEGVVRVAYTQLKKALL